MLECPRRSPPSRIAERRSLMKAAALSVSLWCRQRPMDARLSPVTDGGRHDRVDGHMLHDRILM